ncbi:MAG: multifunctional oxoglutarate decarboxylase/oxoglutarate dehydrogenase thiamine pyrophosphate-binding subunit/dihydrolipoyllysine-residue succinyltransferase subunit [Pseudonocardiales bacterium]|nr:MAG: multifunctional oxoglutarate decarboxylase/oxoglutarate dehydrogenase thiamine pyrophosphate-binding subunit/dihydrolipoyllysine-residue succinyltransferase subunit [Pseudonocardiales bacterium]
MSTPSHPETSAHPTAFGSEFGTNEWLVEEMYERYVADPNSVDSSWHDFFADYHPGAPGAGPARPGTPPSSDSATAAARSRDTDHLNGAAPPSGTTPVAPAQPAPSPALPPEPPARSPSTPPGHPAPATAPPKSAGDEPTPLVLKGAAARVVANMDASLAVPTATSVRAVPAKLLADNRIVINNHLRRSRGGKVSFTHLIGYALVKALADHPEMNYAFGDAEGRPALVKPTHVNLGLAIDLTKDNGTRSLVVAAIRNCEALDFARFWSSYEDIIRRARNNKLAADDFAGVTISLTNPGGIGTVHSMPRLMPGMGAIVGVGAMEYPAEFQGMSEETLNEAAISKIITLTSTYDHRVIQGAQSGEFLRTMHGLLLGEDGFYDAVFRSLRIPYEPVRWVRDISTTHEGQIDKAARVIELINAYRTSGHLIANTNPLDVSVRTHPDLDVLSHGLTLWDLDREFPVGGFAGEPVMALRDVLGVLRDSYCRRVGIEYMHMTDPEERAWLQARVEQKAAPVEREEQKHILGRLNVAEAFETFLQTKFVGQKRFSLEGAESSIALLDAVITKAAACNLDEVVLGMTHRGRLNVLANIVGKSYGQIFREFEGNIDPRSTHGSGDVKYHLGARGTFAARDGRRITVSLTSNPSHLEAVDPVLEGIVRAKQDLLDKGDSGFTVLPVLVHGDAAFAGQGVVAETLNLSQLRGYRTGGTVHLVINNQVGFTTSPASARSSLYCTDVARMIQAPIFHVNGDDPEACVATAKLAVDFRQAFNKDVVIDMVCYRRRGHNEGDDPSMTQPLMYDLIDAKRSVRKLYTEALVGRGDITVAEAEEALRDYQGQLEKVFLETRDTSDRPSAAPVMADATEPEVQTAVAPEVIKAIGDAYVSLPADFRVHPRLKRILDRRAAMASEGNIDWAFGELLAIGSLLIEGLPVRLAGQDTRRGTFVQRHAVLVDRHTGAEYTPLRNLGADQARFWIYDSLLSEFAAIGFEYGYSVINTTALVCWEAQFGDFANGGQSIVDEFISAGEAKWGQRSGVVLMLPHGYEGQGPDHSSARIERYLSLCAENNMTVAYCSTPANYFHLLRRHARRAPRRPMIVFTPKSLLRLKAATSAIDDFTAGAFAPVLPDPDIPGRPADPSTVRRVLLCSGKVFYDLATARAKPESGTESGTAAIVRLEQLYPLSEAALSETLGAYPNAESFVWVQEEPANQGGWPFMALHLPELLPGSVPLQLVSRAAAASPATGSGKVHEQQQQALVARALTG